MPTYTEKAVKELVECGHFDEAVERYHEQRQSTLAAGEQIDQMVRRLNKLRKDLQGQAGDEQGKIKELRRQMEEISDRSGLAEFMADMFGDDRGAGEIDRKALLNGLRTEVLSQAVVVLLRASSTDDDD